MYPFLSWMQHSLNEKMDKISLKQTAEIQSLEEAPNKLS